MKRFLFGFLAALFLILNTIPYLHILADQSMTDSQLKQIGAFALSSLITTGEATELDFSDYTSSDTDLLLALGELVVTGDTSGLVECGLDWLGGTIDDAYDSAIQSIRTWEYNNLPDSFYYWFIDENPPYELEPSYNNIRDLSQPLRRLITPPDDSSNDSDLPDIFDFLNNINHTYIYGGDIVDLNSVIQFYNDRVQPVSTQYFPQNCTLYSQDILYHVPNLSPQSSYSYVTGINPIITINIISNNDNTYTVDYGNYNIISMVGGIGNNIKMWGFQNYVITSNNGSFGVLNLRNSFDDLSNCVNYIYTHFGNINLNYNNNPWIIYSSVNITYPIVIPGQLTIWNDQPLQYEFPSDTYLKLPDLTTIITNAINNSGVVMWSDIADCFVDVNGQTAVAVTKIVRNDYDNLYMEQYPYPAMLVGMTEQTRFNEHLLDDSHAYLSPMGTVVQETVNVLPPELVGVLAIGAILTIFAVIINRLLE